MKILLSAYACEPDRGSEPGVGWHWATELEKLGHEVWVLTRHNNQGIIDRYYEINNKPDKIKFIYYDLPKRLSWWKKGGRGVRTYNFIWQIGAYFLAKRMHKSCVFDLVHHITFGVVRQPSFMGRLGIPFIFGPLGGGERAPIALRKSYPLRGKFLDVIRDFLNLLVKVDPFMFYTFSTATRIYVKTPESQKVVPSYFHHKTEVCIEIGIVPKSLEKTNENASSSNLNTVNLLYVGRFIYWKGVHLGLRAFKKALAEYPNIRLTMVGNGPEIIQWKKLVESEAACVNWISWVEQIELSDIYQQHDALLFPSLHDSSGNVVLESMVNGLPVICLNLGGPAVMVDDTCGIKVDVENLSEKQVIDKLSQAILELAKNDHLINSLSNGAVAKAKAMSWAATVKNVYRVSQP